MAKRRSKGFFSKLFGGSSRGFQDMMRHDVSISQVIYCLDDIELPKKQAINLASVESFLGKELKTHFDNVYAKYKLDADIGLKVSVDVEGQVGLLCYLADELTRSKLIMLIGKVVYLDTRIYRNRLIVVLVGDWVMQRSLVVTEAMEIFDDLGITFYYMVTTGKGYVEKENKE